MGDSKTLDKARRELEELYLGVPDDSVNLTFQDLAAVQGNAIKSNNNIALEKKSSSAITTTITTEPIQEAKTPKQGSPLMNKLPSLDFNRGLQASKINHHNQHHHLDHFAAADHDQDNSTTFESYKGLESHGHLNLQRNVVSMVELGVHPSQGRHHNIHGDHDQSHHGHGVGANTSATHHHHHHHNHHAVGFRHTVESGTTECDDVSVISMASTYQERGGSRPRRPGIPHSNICTVCSTYIYIFRHRCLVCGRVFCRNCVSMGMGEMTEGRKCIGCLGKRFSQRYIQRAGKVGCCSRYPSAVKQAELKWAEKGPKRTGERAYGHHCDHNTSMGMRSRPRSPITPTRTRTSTRPHLHCCSSRSTNNSSIPPSFVSPLSSPYSSYHAPAASPHHFPL